MSAAREEILDRIRRAVGARPADRMADYAAVPREYRQCGSLDPAACLDLLADRLRDYEAGVYRCARADLPAMIAQAATARGKHRLLIPAGLPREWLPETLEFIADRPHDYAELDASEGALTACAAAIATTGSIVLGHSPTEGRRALTLVPDYHLCVVFAGQVVETVPEAMRRMHEAGARLITTIAGPSATADIEMTRVKGVHGPRTLDAILVEDSAAPR
ncbi:MAG: LUD domain-containing protein [Bryobacteraceae bacterium]|jgi:L-lactate dehydrogenase complex protein LldG